MARQGNAHLAVIVPRDNGILNHVATVSPMEQIQRGLEHTDMRLRSHDHQVGGAGLWSMAPRRSVWRSIRGKALRSGDKINGCRSINSGSPPVV